MVRVFRNVCSVLRCFKFRSQQARFENQVTWCSQWCGPVSIYVSFALMVWRCAISWHNLFGADSTDAKPTLRKNRVRLSVYKLTNETPWNVTTIADSFRNYIFARCLLFDAELSRSAETRTKRHAEFQNIYLPNFDMEKKCHLRIHLTNRLCVRNERSVQCNHLTNSAPKHRLYCYVRHSVWQFCSSLE